MSSVDERDRNGPEPVPPGSADGVGSPAARDVTRSIEHVEHAIAIVLRVLDWNYRLAHTPLHGARTEQRIIDGEVELAILEAELAALKAGDAEAVHDLHNEFARRREGVASWAQPGERR